MRDASDDEPARHALHALHDGDVRGHGHPERTYMFELGARLRLLREERGLTQQALARAAGIATDMVSRLENGHYASPGLRTLRRIADGLGLPVSAVLPEANADSHATPEGALRARLLSVAQGLDLDDLELLIDIGAAIVNRRGP